MTIDTFYLNGHSGINDPNNVWSNDANAADGNTGTNASTSTTGGTNYLELIGSNAPTILDTILMVRFRVYTTGAQSILLSIDGFSTTLYSAVVAAGAPTTYQELMVPTGGWTFAYLRELAVRTNAFSGASTMAKVEIEVTHATAYDFPIMAGNSVGQASGSAASFLPLQPANDVAFGASATLMTSIAPVAHQLVNEKVSIATAPSAGVTRTYVPQESGTDSIVSAAIVDPATTGSDNTHATSLSILGLLALHTTVSGGTAAATASVSFRVNQRAENQILLMSTEATISTSATRFIGIQDTEGANTTSAAVQQYMPESGAASLKNLTYGMSGTIASGSWAVELFVNGVSVSSATLDSTHQTVQDIGSYIVNQGDTVYIRFTPSSPATARAIQGGMEYVAATSGNFILLQSVNTAFGTSGTKYNNWYGAGAWSATEALVQALAYACTLVGMYAILSADTGSGVKTRTLTFRQNGSNTSAAVTFNNSGVIKTWSGSISVATDDLIDVQADAVSTPTNSSVKYSLVLSANRVAASPIGRGTIIRQAVNRAGTY